MQIQIDTGSRLDQSGDTTFGFSNATQRAILLRQGVRDQCLKKLKGRRLSRELRLFAACVYLLIKEHLNELKEIRVDKEYPGHEEEIKWIILNLLKRHFPSPQQRITLKFERIGKKSPAHEIAWRTLRKENPIKF